MTTNELAFKTKIVHLVLTKDAERALKELSEYYHVDTPRLRVGLPKRYKSKVGCYSSKDKTIYVVDGETLQNPFVILHEFYHHIRTHGEKHKGTEKYADKFAREFIEAFQKSHRYSFSVSCGRYKES